MDAAPIVEHIKKDVIDKVFKIKDTVAFHLTPERIGEFNGQSEVDEELGRKDIVEILKDISSSVAGLLSFSSEKKDDNAPKLQKDKEKDTGYVDFFKESLKDGKRPTTALYIKDNGVDDPEIDEAGADRSSLDPQLKLQKYFRQAFQYRMINSLEGTRLQFSADLIAGLTLVLSVTISILLLAGLSESVITAAAILSAIVTFLTGFSSYMGYQNRYEKHCMSSTQFASVQQNIYTVLQTDTDKGIAENIGTLTTDFNNAREQMPIIQDDIVRQYVDEKGYALFPDIVEEMQWNESIEVVQDMSKLKMTTKTTPNAKAGRLQVETMLRKRRRYHKMNKLKLQPRKRVVMYEKGTI